MERDKLQMAWNALQDIKMFFALNERNRHGLEIAQKIIMEQMQAGENPACRLNTAGADYEKSNRKQAEKSLL